MKALLKLLIPLSFIFFSTYIPITYAGINTMGEAIDQAGRQRMLTQRMYKAWAMKGVDISPGKAQEQLDDAMALFDKQLKDLMLFAPTKKIYTKIAKVENQWNSFKKGIVKIPNKDDVADLLDENEDLLRKAHKVVLMLQDASGSSMGRLTNISGRQRMLTQRMAKFYMLKSWGLKDSVIEDEMTRAKNEFQGALDLLKAASENTEQINKMLAKAQEEWNLMKHGLEMSSTQTIPLIVSMTSERLLKTMDIITGLYAKL